VALSDEWVARQRRAREARDASEHAAAERTDQRQAARFERRIWVFGIGAIMALIVGITAFSIYRASSSSNTRTVVHQQPAVTQAHLDLGERVRQRLIALDAEGCTHVVEGATVLRGKAEHVLRMNAGGHCLRAIAGATSPDDLSAKIVSPTGKETAGVARDGLVELEHCPTEDGQHTFAAAADELAYALIDCPPAREKYRDDPTKNGLELVGNRMEQLQNAGCDHVLLPPKSHVGDQTMTAKMDPGRYCAVIIAGSAMPDNALTAAFTTPFGKAIDVPTASTFVEIVHCASKAGPHELSIKPSMLEYYAIGAMDCPKRLVNKLPPR
jgi:hypothetical protein